MPPLPSTSNLGAPADEKCRLCGAPVHFAAGELVTCCGYCGGEDSRVALARAARVDAQNVESSVKVSISDAMCELDTRRRAAAWAFVVSGVVVLALAFTIGGTVAFGAVAHECTIRLRRFAD